MTSLDNNYYGSGSNQQANFCDSDLRGFSFDRMALQSEETLSLNTSMSAMPRWQALGIVCNQETSLRPDELAAAAEVYAESFRGPPWFEQWTDQQAKEQLESYIAAGFDIIIARDDCGVVGIAVGMPLHSYDGANDLRQFSGQGNSGGAYYITDLAVSPLIRGKGLAGELVRQLEELAWDQGFSEILTRTRVDNSGARHVFKKRGFDDVGYYEATTGGTTSERVVMRREKVLPLG